MYGRSAAVGRRPRAHKGWRPTQLIQPMTAMRFGAAQIRTVAGGSPYSGALVTASEIRSTSCQGPHRGGSHPRLGGSRGTALGRHAPAGGGPARGLGEAALDLPGEAGFVPRAGPLGLPIAPL